MASKAKKDSTAFCGNQRLWDLLRYCRHDLFNDGLIDEAEFTVLVQDHPAVERLQSYDSVRAALAKARGESTDAKTI